MAQTDASVSPRIGTDEKVIEMQDAPAPQNGKSWKTDDEQVLPKNNLPLVFFSLLLATFLVRLYQLSCTPIAADLVPRRVNTGGSGSNHVSYRTARDVNTTS